MQSLLTPFHLSSEIASFITPIFALGFHGLAIYFGVLILRIIGLYLAARLVLILIRLFHQLREPAVILAITPPQVTEVSALATTQLFALISNLLQQRSWIDRLLIRQASCSFELVSSKEAGIRYLVRSPRNRAAGFEKSLRAYMPGLQVKETADYLPVKIHSDLKAKVLEFQLAKHFAFPLNQHADLEKHDPLAYLAGNMTQLKPGEILALQIVLKPFYIRNRNISQIKPVPNLLESAVHSLLIPLVESIAGTTKPNPKAAPQPITSDEREQEELAASKLVQPLFSATVRALLLVDKKQLAIRESGLRSSLMNFRHPLGQSLIARWRWPGQIARRFYLWQWRVRLNGSVAVLAASEVGALYHFPFTATTHTEDLLRVGSRELPAPLALKNTGDLDVVFGQNSYGNIITPIGLTDEDRSRHMYLIGQTGSGKSTIVYHMAADDMRKGRGLAVVDPHGDLAEDLLACVPKERANDLIYFNPFDIQHPVGINLLELPSGLSDDDLELEKELACESVISIFRRVFKKSDQADSHRIEYILRNTIYTAFTVEHCTIFTLYELLNNPDVRNRAVKNLTDKHLIHFWKNEFGRAGNYQIVKMVGGVTAKVGRFLFSPIAKRILEQPRSTINFDDIMDSGKILLCNLAEGKLGEDTAQLIGTTVIAKIHQAALRRARAERSERVPFYLFVDEFQNFATSSFTKLLSGGRKFGLRITVAEQSTSQQEDRNVVNVILANVGTMVCFRTASPIDEQLMLSQFAPTVGQGDIGNLPRYRFYMKLSAVVPTEPFSGQTLPMAVAKDPERLQRLIATSRKNYATLYRKPAPIAAPAPLPEKQKSVGVLT